MAVAVFPCTVKTSTDAKSFKLNCGQDSSKIANHAYGTPALPSIAVYIHANASMQRYWRQSQKPTSHRKCLGRARYPMLLSSVMISQTKLDTSLAPLLTNCVMNWTAAWKKTVTKLSNTTGLNHVFKLHYVNPAPGYPPAWVQKSRAWANANVAYRNRPWQHRLTWTHPLKYIIYIGALPHLVALSLPLNVTVKQPSFIHDTKLLRTSQDISVIFPSDISAPFPMFLSTPTIGSQPSPIAPTTSSLTKRFESSISHASFKVTSDRWAGRPLSIEKTHGKSSTF